MRHFTVNLQHLTPTSLRDRRSIEHSATLRSTPLGAARPAADDSRHFGESAVRPKARKNGEFGPRFWMSGTVTDSSPSYIFLITETINGVRVDFYPTNWTNVEDVYAYSKFSEDVSGSARTRRLASDEIQTKVANSKTLAASRTAASGQE